MKTSIGDKFGMLEVIGNPESRPVGKQNQRHTFIECRCDCGTIKYIRRCHLLSLHSRSCGCNQTTAAIKSGIIARTTHGMSKTRLFRIWSGTKDRCMCPENKDYKRYGGRGITVCADWQEFVPFQKWAMVNGYADEMQIHRIDNDKGYSPRNCCFLTPEEHYKIHRG